MDRQRAPRLSLDLLRGFCAAARHLSFTLAARELFVTQSAVSHQVKALEDQLGKRLFRRVNRSLQLTAAGADLYEAAAGALKSIDDAAARLVGTSRTLSVSTTVALASTWLVPRLPSFQKAHPQIDLRVVATNDAVDLERDHIDIAIRFATLQMPTPAAEKIFDYLQFPVCSPALARSRRLPLRNVGDLARHVLIDFETLLYGRSWYDWDQWSSAMQVRNLRGSGWMRLSHYDQVIEAARNGSGVAIGKWPHLTDDLREGRLVAPFGPKGTAKVGAFYLEIAGSAERKAADAFADWLRKQVPRSTHELLPPASRSRQTAGSRARSR